MKSPALLLLMLPLLAGCWAINDVSTNRDFDRSLPYGVEIKSGALSVRAPVVHLINETTKVGISLRAVGIGVIEPERYTAYRTDLSAFEASVERDKKSASVFRRYNVTIRGAQSVVYLMRFAQKDTVKLVYTCFVGAADDGVAVANSAYYFDTAFRSDDWWDKPPELFLRFAESAALEKWPNQALQPTPMLVTPRADARVAPSTGVADL